MTFRSVFDAGFIRTEFDNSRINTQFIPSIWKYVIQNPNCEWRQIPSLPSAAYLLLSSKFKPCTSVVVSAFHSSDQLTTKLLIKLQNQKLKFDDDECDYSKDEILPNYDFQPIRPIVSSQVSNFDSGNIGGARVWSSTESKPNVANRVRIARIFNTYGPRMYIDDGRVVSNFVAQALRKKPLTVYGVYVDGKQTRSFQ